MSDQDFQTTTTAPQQKPHSHSSVTATANPNDREKMSRALGAAFLQHQVQQLERNLDDMTFRRDVVYPANHHNSPSHLSSRQKSNHSAVRSPSGNSKANARIKLNASSSETRPPNNLHSPNSLPFKKEPIPRPVIVIDTSILIFGLSLLKKWKAQGKYRIVIPLDAISTLDHLKTYPRPIRVMVRDATHWLDTQFQKMIPSRGNDLPKGFSPQVTGEECSWDQLEQAFVPPPIEIISVPDLTDPDNVTQRAVESSDMPRRLRSILQCARWQKTQQTEPSSSTTLAVFVPSDHSLPGNINTSNSQPLGDDSEMLQSGAQMLEWAPRFGVEVHQFTQDDLADAVSWIRQQNERRIMKTKQPSTRPSNSNSSQHDSRTNSGRGSGSTDKQLFVW